MDEMVDGTQFDISSRSSEQATNCSNNGDMITQSKHKYVRESKVAAEDKWSSTESQLIFSSGPPSLHPA